MEQLIGADYKVQAYEDDANELQKKQISNEAYSFKFNNKKLMNYGDFLKNVRDEEVNGVYTVKENLTMSNDN